MTGSAIFCCMKKSINLFRVRLTFLEAYSIIVGSDRVSVAQLVEPRIVIPVVVGSSPIGHPRRAITKTRSSIYGIATEGHEGPLAQLVEQLTLNQRVAGSIPARPTRTGKN